MPDVRNITYGKDFRPFTAFRVTLGDGYVQGDIIGVQGNTYRMRYREMAPVA